MADVRHPADLDDDALLAECDLERLRRSGPGGQRRNKVETGVRLAHRRTGLVAEAFESRSSQQNLQAALSRLRWRLALEVRAEASSEPSSLWTSRRKGLRLAVSAEHADAPRLVAEALDQLIAADWHLPAAAGRLGVSSSQLVRLLQLDPRALAVVNRRRAEVGLRPLQ